MIRLEISPELRTGVNTKLPYPNLDGYTIISNRGDYIIAPITYKNKKFMCTDKLKLEILNSSYWEHFKFAKDLAGFLDFDHPKRKKIEKLLNDMVDEIHILNSKIKQK